MIMITYGNYLCPKCLQFSVVFDHKHLDYICCRLECDWEGTYEELPKWTEEEIEKYKERANKMRKVLGIEEHD